jgi:hypothetical protein
LGLEPARPRSIDLNGQELAGVRQHVQNRRRTFACVLNGLGSFVWRIECQRSQHGARNHSVPEYLTINCVNDPVVGGVEIDRAAVDVVIAVDGAAVPHAADAEHAFVRIALQFTHQLAITVTSTA